VRRLNVVVIGAGQVGSRIVEQLHTDHSVTVIDADPEALRSLGAETDVLAVVGDAASRRTLMEAHVADADLTITCTQRDEVNIVAALFAKRLSGGLTVVRVSNTEYLDVWRAGDLEFDLMVSPPLETANAVTQITGVPAARQTDMFADGRVQMVEFDIPIEHPTDAVVGVPLKEARLPHDCKVASIIRPDGVVIPRGDDVIMPGDRIVVIGSPESARSWSTLVEGRPTIDSVVIIGGGRIGGTVAAQLAKNGVHVRVIEARYGRAEKVAEALPDVRVLHGDGTDPDFLRRENIGHSDAVVCALPSDAENLMAAALAHSLEVALTIGIVTRPSSSRIFEQAGVDVVLNPRTVTAEEIIRFTRDPRTLSVAFLEEDRAEVLEIEVRPSSPLIDVPFRELPITDSIIGAIIRDGSIIFPHGDDRLAGGDRVVVFTKTARVESVEEAL
jgi:trk system potassium uptake protein TrkA